MTDNNYREIIRFLDAICEDSEDNQAYGFYNEEFLRDNLSKETYELMMDVLNNE